MFHIDNTQEFDDLKLFYKKALSKYMLYYRLCQRTISTWRYTFSLEVWDMKCCKNNQQDNTKWLVT